MGPHVCQQAHTRTQICVCVCVARGARARACARVRARVCACARRVPDAAGRMEEAEDSRQEEEGGKEHRRRAGARKEEKQKKCFRVSPRLTYITIHCFTMHQTQTFHYNMLQYLKHIALQITTSHYN